MIKIRRSTFETNSSSTHSLIIKDNVPDYSYVIDEEGIINAEFGEFGWEVKNYKKPMTKLSYILTMVAEIYEPRTEKEFYENEDFKKIEEEVCAGTGALGIRVINSGFKAEDGYSLHNGYIDHQSCEFSNIDEFLRSNGVTLKDYLFNSGVIVHTDNDNRFDDYDFYYDDEEYDDDER